MDTSQFSQFDCSGESGRCLEDIITSFKSEEKSLDSHSDMIQGDDKTLSDLDVDECWTMMVFYMTACEQRGGTGLITYLESG